MGTLRAIRVAVSRAVLLFALSAPLGLTAVAPHATPPTNPASARWDDAQSLFAQSARRKLERDFNRTGISYLLLDAQSDVILASHWDDADEPVPVGSLVKPFTALAYGGAHAYRYPQHVCEAGQCWLPRGHGRQDLISAVANSCNSYFRALAAEVTPQQIDNVARDFNLNPPASHTVSSLIGLGREWTLAPVAIAHSYAELARRRTQPGVSEIIEGMRRAAISGTGAEVGRRLSRSAALVKTGTAACVHHPRAAADGFVVALFPADDPRTLLLLRVHGTTGARAAAKAGEILHAIEEQPAVAD